MKLKTLTVKELRAKKPAELQQYVEELETSFKQLHLGISTNKEKQTHQHGVIKKSIARAHTIAAEQVNQEKEK
ncbi:MAG TPA: 50S ribosomal protein L29 [Candidatus Saccharibacteria bacterium]|nr:50S ribosomal protein L29 [Candidatus Saccharibacteria bacterium]